jgi:Fe-S-cluster-containing hydrogenase component 2
MGKHIFANPELCTGCNRCVYVCSAIKEGLFQPTKARIHINNFPLRGYSVPSVCFHCPKPDCMNACPEGAITKDDDGIVLVNAEKCNGCGDCVDACTYGMIEMGTDDIAFKCDYCGGDPACVKECEPGAIVFVEGDKELRRLNGLQMKQRIDTGSPAEKRHQLGANLMTRARE